MELNSIGLFCDWACLYHVLKIHLYYNMHQNFIFKDDRYTIVCIYNLVYPFIQVLDNWVVQLFAIAIRDTLDEDVENISLRSLLLFFLDIEVN